MKQIRLSEIAPLFSLKLNWKSLFDSDPKHVSTFDTFRAIAMLWIICKHSVQIYFDKFLNTELKLQALTHPLIKPIMLAEFGVDIFFVLSGFLIAGILLKEIRTSGKIDIWRFYIRRSLRMLPIYYFFLVFIIILRELNFLTYVWTQRAAWPNFLYINNFVNVKKMLMPHTWSLATEEQFYLLCPIFILFAVKKRVSVLYIFLFILSLTIFLHLNILLENQWSFHWMPMNSLDLKNGYKYFDLIYDKPYIRFSSLIIGAIGGYLKINGQDKYFFSSKKAKAISLSVGLALVLIVFFTRDYTTTLPLYNELFYREIFSIGFLVLMFCSIHIQKVKNLLSSKIFYPLFQLSYGIYLIHYPMQNYIYRNFNLKQYVELFPLEILCAIGLIIGVFSFCLSAVINLPLYLFVEKPFMNIREKYFPSK